MSPVLKLDRPDESREIDFELSWLLSLPVAERFRLMMEKNRELLDLLEKNGHRRPSEIIKRT